MQKPPTLSDCASARARLKGRVHRTPVWRSRALDEWTGVELFLKCENLQKVGAFKARGACNAVFALSDDEAALGVATHSSGNHGQALAWAAAERGIGATVIMPRNAPAVKKAAVRGYGARIIECEPTLAAREGTLAAFIAEHGARMVHPYNDPLVIAGQSTVASELLEQVKDLDAIVIPVGGGGLLSGSTLVCAGTGVQVVGAEPVNADDAARSVRLGVHQPAPTGSTIADGLRTQLGSLAFEVVCKAEIPIVTVDEAAIVVAMRMLFERVKLVVEPSAAVGLAAVEQEASSPAWLAERRAGDASVAQCAVDLAESRKSGPRTGGARGAKRRDGVGETESRIYSERRAGDASSPKKRRIAVVLTGGNVDMGSWFDSWLGVESE